MHGRIETREYYQTEDIKWLNQRKDWKKREKKQKEFRYFISSLPEEIETMSRAVRGH